MQTRALAQPILDPCNPPAIVKARIAEGPARELLEMMEFPSANVRDCKVGEFDIPLNEARCRQGLGRIRDALTKKCELIAEFLTSLGTQIAGEIPPLGFEAGMTTMIRWELVIPPRHRNTPIRKRRRDEEQTNEAEQSWKNHREQRKIIRLVARSRRH